MASVAVDNALGSGVARFRRRRWLPETIPWVTFTTPEVGQIGLTEAQAAGVKGARVSELAMGSVDRAVAVDATEGFIKLIAGPRPVTRSLGGGRLLGATVVGERAGELLGELTLMASTAMFVGRLAQVPHAYPTWSSALGQAASQFFTDAVTGATARSPRAG